jgi:hypothetical protein
MRWATGSVTFAKTIGIVRVSRWRATLSSVPFVRRFQLAPELQPSSRGESGPFQAVLHRQSPTEVRRHDAPSFFRNRQPNIREAKGIPFKAVDPRLTSGAPHRDHPPVRAETNILWWLYYWRRRRHHGGHIARSCPAARRGEWVRPGITIRRGISHRRPPRGTDSRPFCRTDAHLRGGPAVAQDHKIRPAEVTTVV